MPAPPAMSPDPQLGTCDSGGYGLHHQGPHRRLWGCVDWRPVGVPEPEAPSDADPLQWIVDEANTIERLRADLAEVTRQRDEAIDMLHEARSMVVEWSAYASDYFKEKWDLAGDLATLDAFLAAHSGQEQTGDTQR